MDTNVTQTLAQYIVQARYEDFPADIVHNAKRLILDNIGCAFGGSLTDAGKILVSFARDVSDKAESTLIGDGARVSCMVAAGVNAQMANILDFDDTTVSGHPGSPIVQTAISLGERSGASGKEVIEATIAGYEAIDRISGGAPTFTPKLRVTEFAIPIGHHVFAAAVAAAKMLHLDVQQTKHAIGIAGSIAPTFNLKRLTDRPASPTKSGNLWNCWTGISAAFLAQRGFSGPVDYLDGKKGYWSLFTDEVDFAAMTAELGKRYFTAEVQIKPWSTCRCNHPGIQLISGIIQDQGLKPEDIEEIIVKGTTYASSHPFDGKEPMEIWDAIFSTPWAVAMTVLGYECGPDWYSEQRFQDPAVARLTAKVRTEVLPDADRRLRERGMRRAMPVEVEVRARGQVHVRSMDGAKGDCDQPVTDEELKGKFRGLATRCITGPQTEKLINTVYKLEDLGDMRRLTELFKPL